MVVSEIFAFSATTNEHEVEVMNFGVVRIFVVFPVYIIELCVQ